MMIFAIKMRSWIRFAILYSSIREIDIALIRREDRFLKYLLCKRRGGLWREFVRRSAGLRWAGWRC